MANEYADLDEVKDWLGITSTDHDTVLDILREGISRKVDDYCGRRFWIDDTTSVRYYTAEDSTHIWVEDIDSSDPTITVESDDDNDGSFERSWTRDELNNYGYRLEPLNADVHGRPYTALQALANVFPRGNRGVKVTAKHGYASTVPPQVKTAMFLQVQSIWTPSGTLHVAGGKPNVEAVNLEGSDSIEFSAATAAQLAAKELVDAAKEELDPLRRFV